MSGISKDSQSEFLDSGSTALKLHTDTPHLVSMGGDRLSTSVTLHPIPQGRVTLGCGAGVDIPVKGTGVAPLHCHIENSEGVVTIYPLTENVYIDGIKILVPTRLSQGAMLTIGRSNYLRFNHPQEAKLMKSVLPNPRVSMAPINFKSETISLALSNKKPPLNPTIKKNSKELDDGDDVDELSACDLLTKITKFEELATQNFKAAISPKVFSSNLVTVNTPAKDVLGKAPPDLKIFTKNLPQNPKNFNDRQQQQQQQPMKTQERSLLFGKKTNETTKYYNNTSSNNNYNCKMDIKKNFDHNDLNNKNSSTTNKNVNVIRTPLPHLNYNMDQIKKTDKEQIIINFNESFDDLMQRKNDAELQMKQAQQNRMKEQELEKAEQVRLEEILNMCVEYEKQIQCDKNKVAPNRIKTNGSLPRDKRQYGSLSPLSGTPPSSPLIKDENKLNNHSYENVNLNYINGKISYYENTDIKPPNITESPPPPASTTPYENVFIHPQQNSSFSQSPRNKIKTIVTTNRNNNNSLKETTDLVEKKFATLEDEKCLLQKYFNVNESNNKFIKPLEDYNGDISDSPKTNKNGTNSYKGSTKADGKIELERLSSRKKDIMIAISKIKREMAEIETFEEELNREIDLENALIQGEHKSKILELGKLEGKKLKLIGCVKKVEENMFYCQKKQIEDQDECNKKYKEAQQNFFDVEKKLQSTSKNSPDYEEVFVEYLKAQEVLDNEKKTFEDLEFHHLEEEANWLASREELQREIMDLSGKIDDVKKQIANLEQQNVDVKKGKLYEYNNIEKKRMECLVKLEENRYKLKGIENELLQYSNQESEQEISSDSDSTDELEKEMSTFSLNMVHDLSCSVIVSNTKTPIEQVYNMSQSFNEKLLQEKSVLEDGMTKRYPSQDDIDRISKVTSNAPISITDEEINMKTIESLKEIQRKRHLHLCQQGSQVIEQERQRVLALKQRIQEEVRTKWEQDRQNVSPINNNNEKFNDDITHNIDNDFISSKVDIIKEKTTSSDFEQTKVESSEIESPRTMSEVSDTSIEVGGTIGKKRNKGLSEKQRPLTRYLPIRDSLLDLRQHIETAGHQILLCPHVMIDSFSCRGFLHKKGSKLNGWSKRWFVFDRKKRTFSYYSDKSEKKLRGGAYFQAIKEIYLDHSNKIKSPNPQLTFIVKTNEKLYYLMAPSPETMRIWLDVIFTGAEGYQEFEKDS